MFVKQYLHFMTALCCTFLDNSSFYQTSQNSFIYFFLFSETMCLTHLTGKGLQEDKTSALCRPKKTLMKRILPVRYNKVRCVFANMLTSDRMGIPD